MSFLDSIDSFMSNLHNHPGAEEALGLIPTVLGTAMLARGPTSMGTPIGALLTTLGGYGMDRGQQDEKTKLQTDISGRLANLVQGATKMPQGQFVANALRAGASEQQLPSLVNLAGYSSSKDLLPVNTPNGQALMPRVAGPLPQGTSFYSPGADIAQKRLDALRQIDSQKLDLERQRTMAQIAHDNATTAEARASTSEKLTKTQKDLAELNQTKQVLNSPMWKNALEGGGPSASASSIGGSGSGTPADAFSNDMSY